MARKCWSPLASRLGVVICGGKSWFANGGYVLWAKKTHSSPSICLFLPEYNEFRWGLSEWCGARLICPESLGRNEVHRIVCRIEGSAQPPDPSKVQTITRSDLGRSCFRDSNTMPLHTTYHKPNPIAIYRSPEALLHQRISSTSDQTIIMTTYLEELKVGTDLTNGQRPYFLANVVSPRQTSIYVMCPWDHDI